MEVTRADQVTATQFLQQSGGNLELAIQNFYARTQGQGLVQQQQMQQPIQQPQQLVMGPVKVPDFEQLRVNFNLVIIKVNISFNNVNKSY